MKISASANRITASLYDFLRPTSGLMINTTRVASLAVALAAAGCDSAECEGEACDDSEIGEKTDDKDPDPTSAHDPDSGASDAVDAGEEPVEQPFLFCDAGAPTVPISEVAAVTAACETAGIGGWWYCFEDGVNPSSCVKGELPYDPERSGLCLSGTTTVDPEYVAFGAGIGITLNENDKGSWPWNAALRNIIGFKFVVTGDTDGLRLRAIFTSAADDAAEDPMLDLPGVGTYEVLFENVRYPGDSKRAGERVDPQALYDAQIMVVGAESEGSYDVCLTELTPIYAD